MAERRMFTKKITDDDNFIGLSASAQALYFQLSMSADDDGFCNQVSASMFKSHASVQDLESLLSKRYLFQFENGVIVIKRWRMANALRKDRYTPTVFQEELKQLKIKENGAYTFSDDEDVVAAWLPDGCQMVAERLPQDRLGKESIGKDRKVKDKYFPNDDQLNNTFAEYVAMRKKLKKPMTDRAVELAIKKLDNLSGGDNDKAIKILEQSIMNSWQGLFELKEDTKRQEASVFDAWANA